MTKARESKDGEKFINLRTGQARSPMIKGGDLSLPYESVRVVPGGKQDVGNAAQATVTMALTRGCK